MALHTYNPVRITSLRLMRSPTWPAKGAEMAYTIMNEDLIQPNSYFEKPNSSCSSGKVTEMTSRSA